MIELGRKKENKMKKRNCIIGQSGGPTIAINASLAGIIHKAKHSEEYENVYGMINGIKGLLEGRYMDLLEEFDTGEKINALKQTPAMYLGSCRFKLPTHIDNQETYVKLFEILTELEITDFYYIGGNDSMDTIEKLSTYAKICNCPINFIGIPKTIDNDLMNIDYTPGYPSACHYVATSLCEIAFDSVIYPIKSVTIVEIMGRDAGWLTASAQLVNEVYPDSIDLIYMPENIFDENDFLEQVKDKLKKKDHCIIAVSEGIRDQYGMCVSLDSGIQKDAFGHLSNNGCSNYLKKLIGDHLGCKVRAIQLSTLQRCAAHLASYIDIENALRIGSYAINCALDKRTGIMVTISKNRNEFLLSHVDIHKVANHVKPFPLEWIDEKNKKIKKEYIDYVVPLIYKSGQIELPQYLQLNER